VFILDKWKGIRETLPALLVVSGSYTIVQTLTIIVFGPELANILAALVSMGALTIFLKKWQPSHIYRVNQDGKVVEKSKYSLKEIINAWSPFYILTVIVIKRAFVMLNDIVDHCFQRQPLYMKIVRKPLYSFRIQGQLQFAMTRLK
jgi:L-lactate permease